jgi:hypothetical protein
VPSSRPAGKPNAPNLRLLDLEIPVESVVNWLGAGGRCVEKFEDRDVPMSDRER